MPVVRVDNYLDAYRLRAQSADVHEMAGRDGKKDETEFANRQILQVLQPDTNDVLVDVGCGDASLLRMVVGTVQECIGITSTVEEKAALGAAFPNLKFLVGTVGELPIASRSASKIICNSVLLLVPLEKDVRAALSEIARIARPGATIWVGEIPEIDEYAHYGMYRGTSMLGFLWHLFRRNGLRTFLGMIRRWGEATFGKEQIVLNSAGLFFATPDKMISLAESCGLKLKDHFRHRNVNAEGKVCDSDFRYDYTFTV